MADAVLAAVLGGLWVLVGWKTTAVARRWDNPALRAHWLALFALAVALTLYVPAVALAVDGALGVPNLAGRLGQGFGLVAAWGAQVLLLHLVHPTEEAGRLARRRLALLVAALVTMAVAFALAPVGEEALRFVVVHGTAPWMFAFWAAYLPFLIVAGVDIARLCMRYARVAHGPVALALRLVSVGAAVGVVDSAVTVAYLGVRYAGLDDLPLGQATLHALLQPVAAGLVATGSALPALARRRPLQSWVDVVSRRRALRALEPLWRDLLAEAPELVLEPAPHVRGRGVDSLDFQLYRRLIELRDVRLLLRPWLPAGRTRDDAVGDHREADIERRAAVEAASLREAALRRRAEVPPTSAAAGEALPEEVDETGWWLSVAAAWTRLPDQGVDQRRQETTSP